MAHFGVIGAGARMTKHDLNISFPATLKTAAIEFVLAAHTCMALTGASGIRKSRLLRKIADLDLHALLARKQSGCGLLVVTHDNAQVKRLLWAQRGLQLSHLSYAVR
jgi:ABC-type transport system involved in cytochrome c biogenesis ATPase subunit